MRKKGGTSVDSKKKMTGMMIHGFAVAHAVTAALLSQTLVGDEAVLTASSIAMIVAVAKLNGADWDTDKALTFSGIFLGGYIGWRGAAFLVKWIPGFGNAVNAAVTLTTTEVLGWVTYLFIKNGKSNPQDLTDDEKKKLWKEAREVQREEEKESRRLYDSMAEDDKKEYKSIMDQLQAKKLPDETRSYLLNRLEAITGKYIKT